MPASRALSVSADHEQSEMAMLLAATAISLDPGLISCEPARVPPEGTDRSVE